MPPSRETPPPPEPLEPLEPLEALEALEALEDDDSDDSEDSQDDLLPLGEYEDDSEAEVIVGASISLGARQQSDEWAFAAGLEVVESFRGSFDQEDRHDTWALDEPSEEIARGVAWAAVQSGTFPAAEIAPRVASQGSIPYAMPVNRVLGAAAVVGSSGLVAAAAVVLGVGLVLGVVGGVLNVVLQPGPELAEVPIAAPVAPVPAPMPVAVDPEPPPDDEALLDDTDLPPAGGVAPPAPQPSPAVADPDPDLDDDPLPVAAPAPAPAPSPIPDAGPEAPDSKPKRGLFGRKKGKRK